MKAPHLVFSVLAIAFSALLGGCVSLDRHYQFSLSQPASNLYFAEIRWQTGVQIGEDRNWEKKVNDLATEAIRTEFLQLGLPCDTIIFENPTPYVGWVVVRATVGKLSAEDMRKEETTYWKTHISGQRIPSTINAKKGQFPIRKPNQSTTVQRASRVAGR